ncbi:type II secretion system (T2SS) protein F [Herbihabitans rhizosphaerae]|uniref:Type II secretion system (T2SS) protein F n=1 Tax=Herbihabitans rhizosphaerae TaxID=1872711 RepID=A0A4Q7KW24_9PSEU|nr:type II secretion system F family protein [Herbihabitans rhizosphaerae]RZS41258.1 type II secretion system (T2SS) protein F [Herbihabitans rhizosphaerae]
MTTGMTSASILLVAVAVLIDPAPVIARERLSAALGYTVGVRRTGPAVTSVQALPVLAAAASTLLIAVAGAIVVAVLTAPLVWWAAGRLLRADARRRSSRGDPLGLAAIWDLLAACLRAGLPVPTAIRAVAADLPGETGTVLRATSDLLALGAGPEAAWAPTAAHDPTAALARGARRTARSGSALAGLAGALATEARSESAEAAEARSQRAGVLITGPLGLCFLPAFVCLGIVPVVIGLASRLVMPG